MDMKKVDKPLDITVDEVNNTLRDYLNIELGSYEGSARKKQTIALIHALLYQTSVMRKLDNSNTRLTIVLSMLGLIIAVAGIIIPIIITFTSK
jgi:hypothetical protein